MRVEVRDAVKFLTPYTVYLIKRLIDLGIVVYTIMIPVVWLTGGFKVDVFGFSLRATHLYTPLKFLVPLIILRLVITVDFRNLLIMCASFSFSVLIVEAVLRVMDPPIAGRRMAQIHRASPVFGWELIPGSYGTGGLGEYVYINSFGFRNEEYSQERKPETKRIMVIGDSFTFGMSVNLEDTYPKQLERLLNNGNHAYEVINCGVIGHNMWQHYEMLIRRVLPHKPDAVILGLYQDDLAGATPAYERIPGYEGDNPFEEPGVRGFMSYIAVWNVLRHVNVLFEHRYRYRRGHKYVMAIEERKKKWGPENPENTNYRIMAGKLERARYKEFSEGLKKFVDRAYNAGASVLVVMIPDPVQLNDPHMQFVNRHVAQASKDIGVPFLDVTPILEKEPDLKSLYLFPLDAHNSPKGLRIIAETIAQKIMGEHLLEPKSGMGRTRSGRGAE